MGSLLSFFGELPTEAEQAEVRRYGSATAFGCAAALGLIAAGVLVLGTARPEPRSAIPFHDPGGACQEYSGGDTRCPGG
jgi:hypothetical protein